MNSIILSPQLDELYQLNNFIKGTLKKQDFQVDIIIEEIFSNIVNYSQTYFIKANASFEDSILTVEFIDNGFEFNPLLNESPDTPKNIEEAEIGGHGIDLAKKFSDKIDYDRINNENHLKIIKRIDITKEY